MFDTGEVEAYRTIRHEMMDVVTTLPPPKGKAATKVGNKQTDEGVEHEIVGNPTMTGVVCGEHDLLLFSVSSDSWHGTWNSAYPEQSKENGGSHVPFRSQRHDEHSEQQRIPCTLLAVLDVSAVVIPFILDALMEGLVFLGDVLLRGGIQRRVILQVLLDLVLHRLRSEGIPGLILGQRPVGPALQLRVRVEDMRLGRERSTVIHLAPVVRPIRIGLGCLRDGADERLDVGLELVVHGTLEAGGAGVHGGDVGGQGRFFIVGGTADALLLILVCAKDAASDGRCEVGPGWLDAADPKGGHHSQGLGGMVAAAARTSSAHRQVPVSAARNTAPVTVSFK